MTRLRELARGIREIVLLLPALPVLVEQQAQLARDLDTLGQQVEYLDAILNELYVGTSSTSSRGASA